MNEDKRLSPFQEPTDDFMVQLTCEIFKNITEQASVFTGKRYINYDIERMNKIIEFAKGGDYWWKCLEAFCPSVDENKIRKNLLKVAKKNLIRIKKIKI